MRSPVAITRAFRTAKRAQHILAVLVRFGFAELVDDLGLERVLEKGVRILGRARADTEIERLPVEVRVRKAIEELGPTFIKFGQILSTRPDLIPAEWVAELKELQANIPAAPWEDVKAGLESEFPQGLDEVFEHIEPEAMAAASMAQAHRARLKDGTEIVLKILRPGIRDVIDGDMEIMRVLAGLVEKHFENFGYSATDVVDQFAKELMRETDFEREGRSTDRMNRGFEDNPNVRFPKVYWEATTKSVLALEEIHGTLLTHWRDGQLTASQLEAAIRHGTDAVFRQCFEIGFFHADPHPGNIFVEEDGSVCFIDCGMTGHIDPGTAEQLADLVHGSINGDLERVVQVALALTDADPAIALNRQMRADVWEFIDHFHSGTLSDLQMGEMLREFFEVMRKYDLRCPADLVYLIKAVTTIEGVGHEVVPDFDVVTYVRPYLERLLRRRYGLSAVRKRFQNSLVGYSQLASELPGQLRAVFRGLQQKRLTVNIEHKGLDSLTATVESASVNIAYALTGAALFVGSAVLVLADSVDEHISWVSALAGAGFFMGLLLLAFRVIVSHFRSR